MTMVEKCARALADELPVLSGGNLDNVLIDGRANLRTAARAVIEALAVPSEAMLSEGADGGIGAVDALEVWQAMLRAALQEKD